MHFCKMFERLQKKWKVSPKRLVVILSAFAIGGSLCGYLGKKLLGFTGMEKGVLYFILYIIIVTLLWPVCVILISSLLGEFSFFKNYLQKVFNRMIGRKPTANFRIAIFASGSGSNAGEIMHYFASNEKQHIEVKLIVSNKETAGVIEKAKSQAVPCCIIQNIDLEHPEVLLKELETKGITHIVLAGFLQKIPTSVLKAFPNKIVNIHPALLPKYGGEGMYGHHVHDAVKANKEKETGITIHLVNEEYDKGKIIFQKQCPIAMEDSSEEIASKVLALEHLHFAPVIEQWILGQELASLN